ncbi:hypothetical protein Ddye_009541 [Dipteronia dyeriana]|uniref:RING-type E3 ubiquitin transferase n=1 Tax=Dipteronia dyeriana TaxID=168575 RepID=A0AAD9XBQ2_9ROSI|nr:hypothetical protein Ddye_009541 [Dipteronia dyeriana]
MANFVLEFRQNNEIFNHWNFNTDSSGFAIELHVHDLRNNGELRTTNTLYFEENRDFLSEGGMRGFLIRILWPEETSVNSTLFFRDNGVQLILHRTPGYRSRIPFSSLNYLVRYVLEIVRSIRNNPWNQLLRVVPIQLNLVIHPSRQFQFLDDSIIFDGGESLDGRLMQRSDDSIILDGHHQSLEVVAIQVLKEERAEVSTDCSICLESVGVGEIVARMPCSHLFHTTCITRWLHQKPSCPLCRAPAC